eukprot:s1013_g17.t1
MFLLCKIWEIQQFEEFNTLMYSLFLDVNILLATVNINRSLYVQQRLNTFVFETYGNNGRSEQIPERPSDQHGNVSRQHSWRVVSISNTADQQNRTDNKYQDLNNLDEYHQAARLANMQVLWLVLTKEEVNKLKEAETTPFYFQSLHGSIRLPRWDKLILSTSPAAALATWYYHAVVTNQRTELVLLSWEVNTLQQMQRISTACINVFSRGHASPQIQVEAGQAFNMLPSEKATQKVWNLQHVNGLRLEHEPEGSELPASLLRSERRAAVVSEQGEISSDDGISIEDLLKDEVVKQEKAAEELMNVPKVVGCAGTEKGDVPHGFIFPENYPVDPAWDVKSIWNSNKAGLYGPAVQNARYVAVTLAEQQPSGGYYYLVFGDELSDLGTKLNLPMSDCNFGDAFGKFLKTGARPDSEPRALGNVSTSWNGTTWRVYENPVPRQAPSQKERTLFAPINFPSLDAKPEEQPKASEELAFTRNHSEDAKPKEKADPFVIKIKGLSAATTTPKATLHSDVQEIKETLQGLMEEIEALKVAGAAIAQKTDGRTTSYDEDEDVVDIKDLYLAGRLLPKKGHFQIDADGSSSIHEDGVNLRLDPGTSPSPLGGDNDLLVNLAGYSCSKFYGSLRITKERLVGAKGITFFTFQSENMAGTRRTLAQSWWVDELPKNSPFVMVWILRSATSASGCMTMARRTRISSSWRATSPARWTAAAAPSTRTRAPARA